MINTMADSIDIDDRPYQREYIGRYTFRLVYIDRTIMNIDNLKEKERPFVKNINNYKWSKN